MSAVSSFVCFAVRFTFWMSVFALIFIAVSFIAEEVKLHMSERSRMKREVLKAERQIHDLAVAAFAEMLNEARFGQIIDDDRDSDGTTGELES